ncbi:MAG: hypothetical protein HOP19_02245, partial [Acidobacteria bacterium]|nr:hypothetical protein [Acidobacteriota bacterium]
PAAPAQAVPTVTAPVSVPAKLIAEEDMLYRLGPGDVIEVRVFGKPEMSREYRIDNLGRMRPLFIQEELAVTCLTEMQLARLMEDKYRKYLRSPVVDVFVKDYQSQPVAVMGAVMQPSRFKLQRRIRLLELLSQAGGPSGSAGTTINLIRTKEYDHCMPHQAIKKLSDAPVDPNAPGEPFDGQLITLNLRDVSRGRPEANIYVEPGDVISVPEADQVFLTGGVMRPGPIPLRQALRLSEAIGMAGGFFTDVSKKDIHVSRQIANSTQRETIKVDYDAIEKKKADDPILQPGDLIEVRSSTARGIGRSLLGIIAPTAAQLPMRIVRPY